MTILSRPLETAGGRAFAFVRSLALYALEMLVFLAFFLVYFLLRGLVKPDPGPATANALHIVDFERALGIFREVSWQQAALPHDRLIDIANFTYMELHLPLLLVMGLFFFHSDVRKYRVLRNGILLSAFVAVPIYFLFPVTPPRLLAQHGHDLGFVDTLVGMRGDKPESITNWYAAMPSYHFGWISLAVAGCWWCWRSPLIRVGSIAFAGLMWWSIVVTGNHYFVDMVAGSLIVGLCLVAAYRWERWMDRRPEHPVRRLFLHIGGHRLPF